MNEPTNISSFFIAGINYKKTDASMRGDFAINDEQYSAISKDAPLFGVNELFLSFPPATARKFMDLQKIFFHLLICFAHKQKVQKKILLN